MSPKRPASLESCPPNILSKGKQTLGGVCVCVNLITFSILRLVRETISHSNPGDLQDLLKGFVKGLVINLTSLGQWSWMLHYPPRDLN